MNAIPNEFFVFCAALFGLIFGSFLHVCIWRIPQDQSIVFPGSSCPFCRTPIKWYDNIPVFSYLFLKGQCRYCETHIPIRYSIYEAITAVLFMGVVYQYSVSSTAGLYLGLTCVWIVASGIDWDFQYIPDRLSIPLIPVSLLVGAIAQWTPLFNQALVQSFWEALIGLLVGGGVIWGIRIVGTWYFKQEAMGFGDVKLMAYVGGFLGWENTLLCIFLASLVGSIVGLLLKLFGKIEKYGHIPFGPYLTLGAYITLLYGEKILDWYFSPFPL